MKSGAKAWTDLSHDACHGWCHVQSAHIWVCSLPFTFLSLNSVRYFCSVCPARPIATGLIMASYGTWRQQRHTSRDKSVQTFPRFHTASDKSWAWRPGNEARVDHCSHLVFRFLCRRETGTQWQHMLRIHKLRRDIACARHPLIESCVQ